MKRILLAVSGSIAFYKAYELLSMFKKEGFKVKVLLSKGALNFASKMSFEALSEAVLCEENESWANENNHIAFSKDCDAVLFAPASVNSINKLAHGISDTLFIQTLMAAKAPLIIAPAANSAMFLHFSTQNSLKLLGQNGAIIIPPVKKILACKDEGLGALAELHTLFNETKRLLFTEEFWQDKKVIITGGGTREKIDEVRCISNFSSGKMAKALADELYFLGAKVVFLHSNDFENLPYENYQFQSGNDLKKLMNKFLNFDFLFMVAAVSDFVPEFVKGKIKKENHKGGLNLHLSLSEDLLKNTKFKGKKIGFKMEFEAKNALQNAKKALSEKGLDMLCLNVLNGKNLHFGSDENEITLFCKNSTQALNLGTKSKKELAKDIIKACEKL